MVLAWLLLPGEIDADVVLTERRALLFGGALEEEKKWSTIVLFFTCLANGFALPAVEESDVALVEEKWSLMVLFPF